MNPATPIWHRRTLAERAAPRPGAATGRFQEITRVDSRFSAIRVAVHGVLARFFVPCPRPLRHPLPGTIAILFVITPT
jgi:hypothetical protein